MENLLGETNKPTLGVSHQALTGGLKEGQDQIITGHSVGLLELSKHVSSRELGGSFPIGGLSSVGGRETGLETDPSGQLASEKKRLPQPNPTYRRIDT